MPLGPAVRHHLGPLEQGAASLYRRLFFDLDCFTDRVLDAKPDPARILEIGCGDGDVATKLCAAYPVAQYLGIDPAQTVGRRFNGPTVERAAFLKLDAKLLAANAQRRYDLVLLVDVLHHIPEDEDRYETLRAAAEMLAPRGCLIVKEWENDGTRAYRLGELADRYISGDRSVRYMRRNDLLDLINRSTGGLARYERTMSVHPWPCNGLHVYRSTAPYT